MKYHIVEVQENKLDELSLSITLELAPNVWEKLFKKIPVGKYTFIGYNRKWYSNLDYKPAPNDLIDVLFEISYDRSYRHIQPQHNK